MSLIARGSALAVVGAALLATGCSEHPPMDSVQRGYRGTGMVEIFNPRVLAAQVEANQVPAEIPRIPVAPGTPLAKDVYKNVKVLGDLDVGNFVRLMTAMTQWVAPEQGCNYCHKDGNFEEDALYTKTVARRMLQMTQTVNSKWQTHVGATGVTCFTCHRGQPVPSYVWFKDAEPLEGGVFAGRRYGQNAPSPSVGMTSLPKDPFSAYLDGGGVVRVVSNNVLPGGPNPATIPHTEWTYALMMHASKSLGVNCTYCHNSRSFAVWEGNPPTRATAWYGIRMLRQVNSDYLGPLAPVYPPSRLGEAGDAPKANCMTCHQGVFKPLFGVSIAKDYPELQGPIAPPPAPAAAPAEAPPAAAPAPGK
jgi:photosynthetic reaction center cytochrome c subunit